MLTTKQKILIGVVSLCWVVLGAGGSALAYTNLPVPNSNGTTTEICDVRSFADSGDKTLRQRLDLFNNQGEKCLFLIYFLDPGTVALQTSLKIRAYQSKRKDGTYTGTYISGRKGNGTPMGIVIDAESFTHDAGSDCAFMVEGDSDQINTPGFQQIHDVTIRVYRRSKAICDFDGNDVSASINFKDVVIQSKDNDSDGVSNDKDKCPNTKPGVKVGSEGCQVHIKFKWPKENLCNASHSDAPDTDGDGDKDPCDTDDDNDGVVDKNDDCPNTPPEAEVDEHGCPTGSGGDDDQDGDGVLNGPDKCDKDSTGDLCDSSNLAACFANSVDNVCDGAVVGSSIACSELEDMDNDKVGNRCDSDIDGDTLPNGSDPDPYDMDADNDGVNDDLDACPLNNQSIILPCSPTPVTPTDTDPDGDGVITNFPGEDKNGNGIYDVGSETDPINPDTDGDGFKDGADCFPLDAAKQACGGMTVIDDFDSDNDGICDNAVTGTDPVTGETICTPNALLGNGDNCPLVPNADQADADADGEGDACEQTTVINVDGDGDGDGLPDDLEVAVFGTDPTLADTDGDGLSDGEEVNGMTYQGGAGPLNPDVDFDGICDGPATVNDVKASEICNAGPLGTGDNCPIVENPGQEDEDSDGLGDVCQGDLDGDTRPNAEDNCPFMKNEDQEDSDEDGTGDVCEFGPSVSGMGPEGCGCRIDGKSQGGAGDFLPFLAMILPMLMLRIVRKRKLMS